MPKSAEVIVIGSGIGGLCCAALTARAGKEVLVLEAHSQPGGAAHGFERQGYRFESGPSLWSGLSRWPSSNPLAQILRALDQPLDVLTYKDWDVLFPEGHLRVGVGGDGFERVVKRLRGPEAVAEWQRFTEVLQPIAAAADALPLLALPASVDGIGPLLRRSGRLVQHLPAIRHLSGAFGPLVDRHLQDPFLRHWVDLLCFLISGMPMADTNAAAMATLFGEWFDPESCLDFPKGGSAAVVDALVRGLEAHGGSLRLGARVCQVLLDGERAIGVELSNGETLYADVVVSNTDAWGTAALLPETAAKAWRQDTAVHTSLVVRFCIFTWALMRVVLRTYPFIPFGSETGNVGSTPIAMPWWCRFHLCSIPRWHRRDIMCSTPIPRPTSPGRSGPISSGERRPIGRNVDNAVRCFGMCWSNAFPICAVVAKW